MAMEEGGRRLACNLAKVGPQVGHIEAIQLQKIDLKWQFTSPPSGVLPLVPAAII